MSLRSIVPLALLTFAGAAAATSGADVKAERAEFISECGAAGNTAREYPARSAEVSDTVRVSDLVLCTNERTNRVILYLTAAAMNQASYTEDTEDTTSPWFGIRLVDAKGETVWEKDDLLQATVADCGRYQSHIKRLPARFNVANINDVEISMEITLGRNRPHRRCDRSGLPGWNRQDLRNWMKDAADPRKQWEEA